MSHLKGKKRKKERERGKNSIDPDCLFSSREYLEILIARILTKFAKVEFRNRRRLEIKKLCATFKK